MNKRAICFLVDPYYIDGTAVTLQSIIDIANKDLKYDVFMLHEYDSITETDQIKFLNYFKKYENWNILFCTSDKYEKNKENIAQATMSNAPLDDFRRGNTKFYLKLFLADAIPRNYDTCLFIDSDLLAVNDFDLLYSFPLHKPIAAAIDQDYMLIDAKTENLLHGYFNTGVFILDLHDARSNFLEDTFLQDMVTTYYRIVDQDFLNIFYKYKFDYLSLTTNVLEKEILPLEYNKKSAKNRLQRLRAAQKDGYQNKVLFIHFTALCSYKPWDIRYHQDFINITGQPLQWYHRKYFQYINSFSEEYFKTKYLYLFQESFDTFWNFIKQSNYSKWEIDNNIKRINDLYNNILKRTVDIPGLLSYWNVETTNISKILYKSEEFNILNRK